MSEIAGNFQESVFSERRLPLLEVHFRISLPDGTPYNDHKNFWVDSGYTGYLKLQSGYGEVLKKENIRFVSKLVTNAGGPMNEDFFLSEITKISLEGNEINLPEEPFMSFLGCAGPAYTPPLIGLKALEHWKICLNLPEEILSLIPGP